MARLSDEHLRIIIDKIFDKYDKDSSLSLEFSEFKQVLAEVAGVRDSKAI